MSDESTIYLSNDLLTIHEKQFYAYFDKKLGDQVSADRKHELALMLMRNAQSEQIIALLDDILAELETLTDSSEEDTGPA